MRLFRGELDERVELMWIVPGKGEEEQVSSQLQNVYHLISGFRVAGPGKTRLRVWLRRKNASNVMIEGAGHLIPQEKPRELGKTPLLCWHHFSCGASGGDMRLH